MVLHRGEPARHGEALAGVRICRRHLGCSELRKFDELPDLQSAKPLMNGHNKACERGASRRKADGAAGGPRLRLVLRWGISIA